MAIIFVLITVENSSNSSIVLMYHDEFYEDELGNTKMITVPIAPDFDMIL